jgi:uncharacterized protein
MIINKTIEFLKSRHLNKWDGLSLADVRMGLYLTAVKLSDGSAGVASTMPCLEKQCKKENRRYDAFSPLQIKGRKVADMFAETKGNHMMESLRMATLNALSSHHITNGKHTVHKHTDPIDLLDLGSRKKIVIVGAFQSYIRKVLATGNTLHVLELDRDALTSEQQCLYVPAADAHSVIPAADIVIMTGMTLVNHTLDGLLELLTDRQQVVVTGPSSSIVPDVLFAHKVDIIGATLITDPGKLLDLVSEAGAGYHLFHYCAEKVSIVRSLHA